MIWEMLKPWVYYTLSDEDFGDPPEFSPISGIFGEIAYNPPPFLEIWKVDFGVLPSRPMFCNQPIRDPKIDDFGKK